MRSFYTILFLLIVLISAQLCLGEGVRVFSGNVSRLGTPFQADVAFHIEAKGHKAVNRRTLIWCKSPECYRLEMVDWPAAGLHNYLARSGYYVCAAIAEPEYPDRCKWGTYPAFWMGKDMLRVEVQRKWKMRDATLLGVERLHGLRVQHWRGYMASKLPPDGRTLDIWQSTDKRFPLVMKVQLHAPRSSLYWEITKLRLGEPIPSYIFTAQVRPKGGLLAQMKLPCKPLWMILLWHALILMAYARFVFALMKTKSGQRRVWSIAISALVMLGLLWVAPKLDHYHNHLSGLPVLLLLALMSATMLVYCRQKLGMPGDIRLFVGTPWHVFICAILVTGIGLALGYARGYADLTVQFGLADLRLAFLPQTLLSVFVFAATWTALEEVVFRGYVTGLLISRFSSARLVNVIQALAFTAVHIPRYLNRHDPWLILAVNMVIIFLFGGLFGALRLKYRNLGAPWIVHTAYNVGFLYGGSAAIYTMLTSLAT